MYFWGRIAEKDNEVKGFIYRSQRWLGAIHATEEQIFNQNVLQIFGGIAEDYASFELPCDSEEAIRISKREEFELIWTGDIITNISMAPEDSKPILKIALIDNKNLIKADGIDSCTIEFKLVNDSDEIIPITIDIVAPVKSPTGANKLIKCEFINGVCSKVFKTLSSGEWLIPSIKPQSFRFFDTEIYIQSYDDGDII